MVKDPLRLRSPCPMAMTCARCGRSPRAEELVGPGMALDRMSDDADPEGRVLLEGKAWARVVSADVCPDCLTPEEERELARSYIQMIEAEVERLQASGGSGEPHEAALIRYALVLRSRLADANQGYPPPPEGDAV